MREERVRDPAEPLHHLAVPVHDRLVRDVTAGQHDRPADGREQQVVQRGVRQHQPELPVPGGDRRGDRVRRGGRGQQHDRPAAAGQQAGGGLVHLAQPPRGRHVGHHHGERLVLAVLARPQRRGGRLAGRVHGQVVAAQALDGQHLALPEQVRGRRERLAGQYCPGRVSRASRGPQAGQQVGCA